jgi:hypothetical protein
MEIQRYYFKVSPENVKTSLTQIKYTAGTEIFYDTDPCCPITATTIDTYTGTTGYYRPIRQILSGGTNGVSLLTGLTIPVLFTQTAIDIGYYSLFDGAILQKEVINNFLFESTILSPYTFSIYNTSELEFKKFLSFVKYSVNWGDFSPIQQINGITPLTHTYTDVGKYKITIIATSPWGTSTVIKTITVPFTNVPITNPNGTAFFTPAGGNWSSTLFNYDYIFSGDSNTNINEFYSSNYTSVPFIVTGYTQSSINDLIQYGPKQNLFAGKFKIGVEVTGSTGNVGTFWGPNNTNIYTAYTINGIDYYDYNDGTTLYVVESSGLTKDDLILSALTKNEAYLNVIDEPEIQSNIFIDRGKITGLEQIERLGEVDNIGDLEKYGYGYFKVEKQ